MTFVYSCCVQDAILKAAKRSTYPSTMVIHCSFRPQDRQEITMIFFFKQSEFMLYEMKVEILEIIKANQRCFSKVRLSHVNTAEWILEAQDKKNLKLPKRIMVQKTLNHPKSKTKNTVNKNTLLLVIPVDFACIF